MGATPAEPAAARRAGGAGGTAAGAATQLRAVLLALGGSFALLTLLLIAYGLATARVPQHRAALEDLIRHQTGLEVRFNSLAVRWGWYGPEALFHDVELGEPRSRTPLLRAQRLIVALDAWQMARSGHLEARRITLENPAIDLAGNGRGGPLVAAPTPAGGGLGARVLARWRGGQIDISGGTLRTLLPGTADAVTVGISHAELRRLNTDWSAEARLSLPPTLGASLHVALQMRSAPDLHAVPSAKVTLEGRRLQMAAWGVLAGIGGRKELPRSGSGDLEMQASFVDGRLRSAAGRIAAEALEWSATDTRGPGLAFERLRGKWQLEPRGTGWRLSVDALELDSQVPTRTAILADIAADGMQVRGQAQHAPVAALLSLARWYAAQPAGGLVLAGEAHGLSFDWDARRPPGTRLAAAAELQSLTVADDSQAIVLSGLSGNASGSEASVAIRLRAREALLAVRSASSPLDGLGIDADLNAMLSRSGGWRLETHDLQIRRQGLSLSASGAIGSDAGGAPVLIDAHLKVKDSDIAPLANLLGEKALAACGEAGASLCDGRVERAELSWRGPLIDQPLSGGSPVDWQATRLHASIGHARAGGLVLSDALTDWDGHAAHALRFRGHVAGDARELSAWLQSHPQAASWAPGLQGLELQGSTVLDLDVAMPAAVPTATARQASPRVRVAALLDGAQLSPIAGIPALTALRGMLGFSGGHLQPSMLTARWLGGPASLTLTERREQGLPVLVVAAHGVMDAAEAMQAAAGAGGQEALSGSAEWNALLTVESGGGPARWQLHADSSLTGTASALPEPFAKASGAALPLHVDWEALDEAAQLHVALGERLVAVAQLTRSGDSWRIERGAVRLGGATPALPVEPLVLLDGTMSRLDLAASLALWRQAARDAALPPLRAQLSAMDLSVGTRHFREVSVTADAAGGAGALQVHSPDLSASARWSSVLDAAHPALVHLPRFNILQSGDAAVAAELAAALAPAAELAVDDLEWRGRSVGSFSGAFALREHALEASDLVLSGPNAQTRGSAACQHSGCRLAFALDSADPGATLAAFGFAAELSAQQGHLEGQLHWLPQAPEPLATLGGSLHMRLEEGIMSSTGAGTGIPFALLSVPALLAGVDPDAGGSAQPALRFARLSADYDLQDGQAVTPGLHFDGDAEILVRGRVGLSSGDYDQQAWILSGEERLPAALRRLGPSPRVAAAWLSLRDMLGSERAARARTALRLRGPWSDPIVTPME